MSTYRRSSRPPEEASSRVECVHCGADAWGLERDEHDRVSVHFVTCAPFKPWRVPLWRSLLELIVLA